MMKLTLLITTFLSKTPSRFLILLYSFTALFLYIIFLRPDFSAAKLRDQLGAYFAFSVYFLLSAFYTYLIIKGTWKTKFWDLLINALELSDQRKREK